jgi:hypothetical protein
LEGRRTGCRTEGRKRIRPVLAQIVVAGLVAAVVSNWHGARLEPQAHAEPRRITPQEADQHFKSGGRLSEAVLQEILVVLKRMDERLERLEKLASAPRGTNVSSTPADGSRQPASESAIQVRRNP